MGSGEMIALQTSLKKHFQKIPFAYKRASTPFLDESCCPVYGQRGEAIGVLSRTPLDRFSRRAQDCSYTNESAGGE
jgi:hypothetical protein